jgi:SAM-dependent methyltransferase
LTIDKSVSNVAAAWENSPYYERAEKWTYLFWDAQTPFRRLFDQLDLTSVLELACGHGRHAERCAPLAVSLTLMDIFEKNVQACRMRLAAHENVNYVLGSGAGFAPVPEHSLTAIYCYDAMVHFSEVIAAAYLEDSRRVLRSGGMEALYHHSNFAGPGAEHYGRNPAARNVMTQDLFSSLAGQSDLEVVESHAIDWAGHKKLDAVTLVSKR